MAIYTDNYFTNDCYEVRTARLEILKNYIEYWATPLNIPHSLVNWGLQAADRWKKVLQSAHSKKTNSENFFHELRDADEQTFKYYLRCKRLYLSAFSDDQNKLRLLGVNEKFPRNRSEKIAAVEKLLKISDRFLEQEAEIIPKEFIQKLKNFYAESVRIYQKIEQLKAEKNSSAGSPQMELFKDDSRKLRSLFSWALMTWDQDEPYLVQLGFAVQTRKRKHETEEDHED